MLENGFDRKDAIFVMVEFKSLGVKVLCVFHLLDNVAFTFQ